MHGIGGKYIQRFFFGKRKEKYNLENLNVDACQSTLQPWVSLGLLYNQSPRGVRFLKASP
jgi:hypothetical protein